MTMNLQQQSDECGYALEAFGKVLKNNNIEVEGKPNIELIMEYQKEYRKIEVRNREIENEVNLWKSWFDTCYQLNNCIK